MYAVKKQTNRQLPPKVLKRIVQRLERGEEIVVLIAHPGKPMRVFGRIEYQNMCDNPKKVRPWEHRNGAKEIPDPLGAVEGTVLGPVTRQTIYEE